MGNAILLRVLAAVLLLAPTACRAQGAGEGEGRPAATDAAALPGRLEALRARLARAEAQPPGTHAQARRVNLPLARLHLEKAERFLASRWGGEQQAAKALDQAAEVLALLSAGKEALAGATGLVERAYVSPADGSVQPYWIYVPKGSAPQGGWPVLVYLHGYVSDTSKINPWLPGGDFFAVAEEKRFLVALPHGRSNTDFEGIGEQDVLTVIAETKRHYPVNADRFFLSGPSMGGYGVYVIGLHYPHLFAGLAPMCGRSVPYVVETRWPDDLPPFKRLAVAANVPLALVENAKNLPIFLQQGERDYLIDPNHSRTLAARWQQLGYAIQYDEWPGHSHYIYWEDRSHAAIYDWAKSRRRNAAPRTVVYTTYTPKYGRAYWITIQRLREWGKPARVEAHIGDGNRVTVKATNVAGYSLTLPAGLADAARPLVVVTNGKAETHAGWKPGVPLAVALEKPPAGLWKSASRCGPVREVFLSPFLLVPGTRGDAATTRRLAGWAKRWAEEWHAYCEGMPPTRRDTEVTAAEMKTHNLVLFGDRQSNALLARVADRLPVELTPTGYRLGTKTTRADGLGLLMTYPNPLAPERLLCVYSGEFWGDGLDVNHKFDLVPDFIFFRNELDTRDPSRTPTAICAGFFDSRWQFAEALTWQE